MFPLVDTHLHLWDPGLVPWVRANQRYGHLFNRVYDATHFAEASADCQVQRAVFVQCNAEDALAEVAWVAAQAAIDPRIAGIVAHAPIEEGAAVAQHLRALTAEPLVRGIRRMFNREEPGFCTRPEVIAGVQALAAFDLVCELTFNRPQFPEVIALVQACPHVRFMVDHLGSPPIAERTLDGWAAPLVELAALPNVWCKISGMVTGAGAGWNIEQLAPYVAHVLTTFTPARLCWGSDWPVVLKSCDYRHWVDVTRTLLVGLPPDDQRRILHDNAITFYGLAP